jgi:CRP-like cAMP-binding protein
MQFVVSYYLLLHIIIFSFVHAQAPDVKIGEETRTFPKTLAERYLITRALNVNILFSNLKNVDSNHFVDEMEPELVPAGTDIVVLGEHADHFYIVKEGTFSVIKGTKKVATFERGSSFGETELLFNSRQNATVRAESDVLVWKLDRTTFRKLLSAKTQTSHASDIITSLKSVELLQGLSEESISKLAEVAVQIDYEEGQTIVKKAETAVLGYFVMKGVVRVTDLPNGIPDMTYGPGEQFGFHGLLTKETRQATVVADTDVSVAAFGAKDIIEIIGSIEQLILRDHQMKRLKSVPLFSEFSHVMLASLLPAMQARTYQEGEHIIRQGEIGTNFFLVQKGECNIVHNDEDGNSTVIKTLGELSYFGEMALLSQTPRSADVIAATECKIFMVEHATFQRMFGSSLSFSRKLNEVVRGRDKALRMVQNPIKKITIAQLNVLRVLGQGTFGTVALAEDTRNGLHYAIKAMSIEFIETNKQEVNIVNEKVAMLQCNHPFILKLHATMKDVHRIYFFIDPLPGGELFDRLHNEDGDCVPESQVGTCCRAHGFRFCVCHTFVSLIEYLCRRRSTQPVKFLHWSTWRFDRWRIAT